MFSHKRKKSSMCTGNETRNSVVFKELGKKMTNVVETLSKDEVGDGCSQIIESFVHYD